MGHKADELLSTSNTKSPFKYILKNGEIFACETFMSLARCDALHCRMEVRSEADDFLCLRRSLRESYRLKDFAFWSLLNVTAWSTFFRPPPTFHKCSPWRWRNSLWIASECRAISFQIAINTFTAVFRYKNANQLSCTWIHWSQLWTFLEYYLQLRNVLFTDRNHSLLSLLSDGFWIFNYFCWFFISKLF